LFNPVSTSHRKNFETSLGKKIHRTLGNKTVFLLGHKLLLNAFLGQIFFLLNSIPQKYSKKREIAGDIFTCKGKNLFLLIPAFSSVPVLECFPFAL